MMVGSKFRMSSYKTEILVDFGASDKVVKIRSPS